MVCVLRPVRGLLLLCAAAPLRGAVVAASGRHPAESRGSNLRHGRAEVAEDISPVSAEGLPNIRPQIFLLFLVYEKIHNVDVWDRFLDGGVKGSDYTALVHCKSEAKCRDSIKSHRFEIIPSVTTRYCLDLVSGMNQLLKVALQLSGVGSTNDKFVFLSDTTLPVKPFSFIYDQLTVDRDSDFCIFPRNEWAEVSGLASGGGMTVRVAPKHHQWIVLNRKHALESVHRSREQLDLMSTLHLNLGIMNKGYSNTGCLDEFWHFQTAYRSVQIPQGHANLVMEDFNGGPLSTTNYQIQGRCNTFVHWVPRASGSANNITDLAHMLQNDAGTDLTPPTDARPASFQRLGRAFIVALRNSPFLFVRKVDPTAIFSGCERLSEAFASLAFAATPAPIQGQGQDWRGTGTWLDNRRSPVVINSRDGAATLAGRDRDMQAKGYYCGDRLEVIFISGYRASAVVSADGKQLHWANGVVWPRANS
mmetsp:Transcript_90389/g.252615  ORF Transcript_90389/g.252615 Transcript_90389/m.252615 type:complete len:476 (-) Transcript_90389:206-1633(-)